MGLSEGSFFILLFFFTGCFIEAVRACFFTQIHIQHLGLYFFNPAENREGKCPVVSDDPGGCCHSRTSSYASQQSKLSGKGIKCKQFVFVVIIYRCSYFALEIVYVCIQASSE